MSDIVANCDHVRACFLALATNVNCTPPGVFGCTAIRESISNETGPLFEEAWAVRLLEIVNLCEKNGAAVVVPNVEGCHLPLLLLHRRTGDHSRAFSVQCVYNGTYARFQRCVVALQPNNKLACKCSRYLAGVAT